MFSANLFNRPVNSKPMALITFKLRGLSDQFKSKSVGVSVGVRKKSEVIVCALTLTLTLTLTLFCVGPAGI